MASLAATTAPTTTAKAPASLADLAKRPSSSSSGINSENSNNNGARQASPSTSAAASAVAASAAEAAKQQQIYFDAGGPDGALARVAVAIGVKDDERSNGKAGNNGFSSLRFGGLRRGVIIDAAAPDAGSISSSSSASASPSVLAAKNAGSGSDENEGDGEESLVSSPSSQDALGPFPLLPETHPADAAARGMLTMAAGAAHGAKGLAGDVERGAAELAVNGPRAPPGADKKKR